MPVKKLKDFLDRENVKYVSIYHSIAYTAQEIAASVHVKGKEMAKTVMVKLDGKLAMAVLPASHQVNFEHLKKTSEAKEAMLATEKEFKDLFPDCDIGAMPPFGNLYGMDVFVSQVLTEDKEIAFNAGSHYELIKLAYKDFEKLVRPKIAGFSVKM
ncbi:MAG: deacylase [Deltaproteobacteria bacterium RBG_16_49_23]|nr:MAG: deacylase [Deltaproteobacteria bacterium RBG_16_49_23]